MPLLSPLLHDISNGKKQAKSILIKDCQGISNALWRPLSPKYGYLLKWLWDCRTYTAKIWLHTCIKKQVINTWKGYKVCCFKVSKSYKLSQCNTAKGIGNQNVPCVTNRGKKCIWEYVRSSDFEVKGSHVWGILFVCQVICLPPGWVV